MKKYFLLIPFLAFIFSCHLGSNDTADKGAADSASAQDSTKMNPLDKEMREMAAAQKKDTTNPYRNAKIDVKVFKNDTVKVGKDEPKLTGYGYNIYIFDALYVHQPHIPAINGSRGFKTKEQANQAAEFVSHKIRHNIMPPSLSVHELDSLGVLK